jgi:type IV pilus assembly protein PilA
MKHKGFTLIELMIVVAIIGILAAVAIPQYQNYVARAQVAEGLSLASGAKVAIAEYFNSTGSFPVDNSTAGLTEPTDFKGNWVDSVTVSVVGGSALITALFSSTEAHSKLHGGEIAWVVGSNTWHDQDEIRDIADTHLGGAGISYLWLTRGACETTP